VSELHRPPGPDELVRSQRERLARLIGAGLGRVRLLIGRLPTPKPWLVLTALVVAGWAVTLEVGRIAQHNGWFYFHGGDATWYYTSAWVLGQGHIPQGSIGYWYSLLLAPIAHFAGPNILVAMPWIVVFNVVVLAPIALLSIYGITCMIGGRSFGYLASLIWVVFPVAVIHYFSPGYHARYVDITLPPALGLTARGDFPSLVFLLVATYFGLRFLATQNDLDAIASGLAVGLAIAIKPSNALFLPAPALALVVARRPRGLALLAVGLLPSLIGLAVWKYRGLGYLPAFSNGPGATLVGAVVTSSSVHLHLSQYLPFSWSRLSQNLDGFGRWTWSRLLIELVAVVGLVGLVRRSLPAAVFVGAWLASYLVFKGSSPVVNFADGTFLTHLIPAFPAYFLLAVSSLLLIPSFRRRPVPQAANPAARARWQRRIPVLVLALAASVGALVIAILPPLQRPAAAEITNVTLYIPIDGFALAAQVVRHSVKLSWPAQRTSGSRVWYAIFRDRPNRLTCTPVPHAATACSYPATNLVGSVAGSRSSWVDHPPPGTWVYRVSLTASPSKQFIGDDYILLSDPTRILDTS
jgi:hypothetical protein